MAPCYQTAWMNNMFCYLIKIDRIHANLFGLILPWAGVQSPEWAPRTFWCHSQPCLGADPFYNFLSSYAETFDLRMRAVVCRLISTVWFLSEPLCSGTADKIMKAPPVLWWKDLSSESEMKKLKLICSVIIVLHARLLPVLAGLIKNPAQHIAPLMTSAANTAHMLHISKTPHERWKNECI